MGPQEPSAYGVSELVANVLAIADGLGRDSFDLVGDDWGGADAWWTTAPYPERLRSDDMPDGADEAMSSAGRTTPTPTRI